MTLNTNYMMRKRFIIALQWLLLMISLLLSSMFVSWHALVTVNFLYPVWYEVIDIDENIATYGPRNRYRLHFEKTGKEEQARLFAGIVQAIHHHGEGLETLIYHDREGRPVALLLTVEEITHLKDVANLIDVMRPIGWLALISSVLLVTLTIINNTPIPSVKVFVSRVLLLVGAVIGLVMIAGPVDVFYGLHTLVFPAGHAWFFYYEDSLMSMMMKAPDLFACIAILWLLLALMLVWAVVFAMKTVGNFRQGKK